MYKKALSSFFLKVHPDFFHFNPQYQRINETAVAQLNELLGWAKEFKKGAFRPPPAQKIDFTFYRRVEDDEERRGMTGEVGSASSTTVKPMLSLGPRGTSEEEVVLKLHSRFELPANFKPQEGTRGVVERSVNKFLRDLLRRAECLDAITESISVSEDKTAERLEERPLRRRPRPTTTLPRKSSLSSVRGKGGKPMQEGEENARMGPRTLLDEAVDSLQTSPLSWSFSPFVLPKPPTLDELISADQIFFSTSLSPLQCASALYTLREHLPALEYHQWESMPVVIGHRFEVTGNSSCTGLDDPILSTEEGQKEDDRGSGYSAVATSYSGDDGGGEGVESVHGTATRDTAAKTPLHSLLSSSSSSSNKSEGEEGDEVSRGISGGFTIPWNFTPSQFLAFLHLHRVELQLCKSQIEQRAMSFEHLLGELCRALRLDDLLLSCAHREAYPVMKLFSHHTALLDAVGVTDLTIELGDHYATRENGVLIVDVHRLKDYASLQSWLTAIEPKLKLQKELYRVSKQLLETTMWYVKEVERVLELSPGQVDAFDHNDCTYAERLQWVKELFRISAGLSKWDWGEFKFILGPRTAASGRKSRAIKERKKKHLLTQIQKIFLKGHSNLGVSSPPRPETDTTAVVLEVKDSEASLSKRSTFSAAAPLPGEGEGQAATGMKEWNETDKMGKMETHQEGVGAVEEHDGESSIIAEEEEEDGDEEETPVMDLNWDQRVLVLPYEMDGDAFLRYVEIIQQEAKAQHRASLESAVHAKRMEVDMEQEEKHRQEMLLEMTPDSHQDQRGEPGVWGTSSHSHRPTTPAHSAQQHEQGEAQGERSNFTAASSPPPYRSYPTRSEQEMASPVYPSATDILFSREAPLMTDPLYPSGSPQSSSSTGKGEGNSAYDMSSHFSSSTLPQGSSESFAPYMQEYMTSSHIGDPDALTVERPLHHQDHRTTFESDEAAEDQLKWEGFYQSPFVDQVPTGDLDDLSHAFHVTNRAHREAAAKKLLEELQGTYGKKSRRFDYQKMGDILEINNARVQPKGFPILTKGIKSGNRS